MRVISKRRNDEFGDMSNAEKEKARQKAYRETHKEVLKEKAKERVRKNAHL